jgi:glycosyltransferase involved in cell wall biosynthesis
MFLSVLMPCLNEEGNVSLAIKKTLAGFDRYRIKGEIVVIDDGSNDRTAHKIRAAILHDNRIRLIQHARPRGVGASFWHGVHQARGDCVVFIPGDNENDPNEIFRYADLLNDVDMVIPYLFDQAQRTLWRSFLSRIYMAIINLTFQQSLNYTNGTILYRKSLLMLINKRCYGFFFQTDIVIRLIKKGYLYCEAPYQLNGRKKGQSKAIASKTLAVITLDYLRLLLDGILVSEPKNRTFTPDSVSARRCSQTGNNISEEGNYGTDLC